MLSPLRRRTKTQQKELDAPAPIAFPYGVADLETIAANTGIKVNFLRTAIGENRLDALVAGKKHLITSAEFDRFVKSLPTAQDIYNSTAAREQRKRAAETRAAGGAA